MTPTHNIAIGAARQYTEDQLGGPCVENESTPLATTTSSVAIDGNGDRVGLLIINIGAQIVYIALGPNVSAANGIQLAAGGGVASFNVRDDFTLPTRRWYMLSGAATSQMYVLEINRFTLKQGAT